MFELNKIVRPHLLDLKPYSSARDEFSGEAKIYLDANENSLAEGFNRYPDPHQTLLKTELGKIKSIRSNQIFLGNGSDEAIDLLIRAFCEPGKDNIVILPPTYGMYEVSASINNVEIKKVLLTDDYNIDKTKILAAVDSNSRLIFICSPNNPTGNLLDTADIKQIADQFEGIVVVDEAYIDFAKQESFISKLGQLPNLVVLQTFSKAWGLANLRVGMAFASREIIDLLNKIKPPYNISGENQKLALQAIENKEFKERSVNELIDLKEALAMQLSSLKGIQKVYPSDANFLLVKMENASSIYQKLIGQGIVLRDRSKVVLCEDCLRITIGTKEENQKLIQTLKPLLT